MTQGESKLAKQLTVLENRLYGKENTSWDPKELSAALNELKLINSNSAVTEKKSDLPPLHLIGE